MRIQTKLTQEKGQSRTTAFGEIKFDEDGYAEVTREIGEALIAASPSLIDVDNSEVPGPSNQIKKDDLPKTSHQGAVVDGGDPNDELTVNDVVDDQSTKEVLTDEEKEREATYNTLMAMKTGELRQMLMDASVSEEEFNIPTMKGAANKPNLVAFVIEKTK